MFKGSRVSNPPSSFRKEWGSLWGYRGTHNVDSSALGSRLGLHHLCRSRFRLPGLGLRGLGSRLRVWILTGPRDSKKDL